MFGVALIFAAAIFSPHYHPRPIHSPSEALAAAYDQLADNQAEDQKTWGKQFTVKRVGNQWELYRGGFNREDIFLSARSGRILKAIVID